MVRLVLVVMAGVGLAACGGPKGEEPPVQSSEAPAGYESDGLPAEGPPPMTSGQGAPAPMNAPPAEYPNVYEPEGEPAAAGAAPGLDRGLPVCPGDPRCKKKK